MPDRRALHAIALVLLALLLGGCGSGSSASTSESEAAGGSGARPGSSQKQKPTHFKPPSHHDSGGGAEQFETKGGDNSIQEAGDEASSAELEEAAAVLHAFLDARAARAWAAACERLAPLVATHLAAELGGAEGEAPGCAKTLAGLTAAVPDSALRAAAVADVGAFRVDGEQGFLIFRGARHHAYFMPMVREGDAWKVAAIAASPLL